MMIKQFTDFELFQMFNVDCEPNCKNRSKVRVRYDESEFAMNDTKVPLWSNRKRHPKRGERNALQSDDNIKPGITNEPPGSGRVADLAKYYQDPSNEGVSPFTV